MFSALSKYTVPKKIQYQRKVEINSFHNQIWIEINEILVNFSEVVASSPQKLFQAGTRDQTGESKWRDNF